jgi:hypothetical protein
MINYIRIYKDEVGDFLFEASESSHQQEMSALIFNLELLVVQKSHFNSWKHFENTHS